MSCRSSRLAGAIAAMALGAALAWSTGAAAETRVLKLYNLHTKERGEFAYKVGGRYDRAVLKKVDWFLRDWRKKQATSMDPTTLDTLWEAYRMTGARGDIHIVCGYRSPGTNEMLRGRGRGVAKHSQHTRGKAIDFFIPGVPLAKVRAAGLRLQRGGVGFYPTSGSPFVHLDTGNVRAWPRMSRQQLIALFPDGKTLHLPSDGKPLAGYALAKAEVGRTKAKMASTTVAYADASSAGSTEGGKTISAWLGDVFEKEKAAPAAVVAEAAPAKAPGKLPKGAPAKAAPAAEADAIPAAEPKETVVATADAPAPMVPRAAPSKMRLLFAAAERRRHQVQDAGVPEDSAPVAVASLPAAVPPTGKQPPITPATARGGSYDLASMIETAGGKVAAPGALGDAPAALPHAPKVVLASVEATDDVDASMRALFETANNGGVPENPRGGAPDDAADALEAANALGASAAPKPEALEVALAYAADPLVNATRDPVRPLPPRARSGAASSPTAVRVAAKLDTRERLDAPTLAGFMRASPAADMTFASFVAVKEGGAGAFVPPRAPLAEGAALPGQLPVGRFSKL